MKTYHFLSGLPRSGSTLLSSILNQNPSVYVSPTSPLLSLLVKNQNNWHSLPAVIANPNPAQLTNITRRMIDAAWSHENKPIIIDKCRAWGDNMIDSTILFEKEIKMVATIRDLPSIMASWLSIVKKTSIKRNIPMDTDECLNSAWDKMVKDCVNSLNKAVEDAPTRVLLIEYDDLVLDPITQLNKITNFLNLPEYNYDLDNIRNNTNDDDLGAWGLDELHVIRPTIQKTSKDPRAVLGDYYYKYFLELEKQYRKY
jgi:sulfotransferase